MKVFVMHEQAFAQRSQRAQIAQLRPIAQQVCHAFGVTATTLTCINHGFNTTYAVVDTQGHKYALRLNTHSLRDEQGLHAEVAWMQELAAAGVVRVPQLCHTPHGQYMVSVPFAPLGKELTATMAHWLPGRIVGGRPSYQHISALGTLSAQLHQHSVHWRPQPPAAFPTINRVLLNSPDHLTGQHESTIPAELRQLLDEVRPQLDALFVELNARFTIQPIHADIHPYNVMWHQCELAVFDFDDAGLGLAVQDIANSLYYVRDMAHADEAFFSGYQRIAPVPAVSPQELEGLLMARGIVLLNDLLVMTNPADAAFVPEYLRRMTLRLRHFVTTGRFALCT